MSKIGINEVLEEIIEAIADGGKSREMLLNLINLESIRMDSLEGRIDILMSERKHEPISIEDKVCSKIQERAEMGLNKYGTTMERTDLSIEDWLTHAQEESLDLSIYLEKIKSLLPIVKE